MYLHQKPSHIGINQQGIVSIMVAMVLMAVMTLIVLGFAEISRRDQRETLDRQLSAQAFYAAETGVNDAQHVIETDLNNGTPVPEQTDCNGQYQASISSELDTGTNVRYTCLLVDPAPMSLHYMLSPGDTSKVFPLESGDAGSSTIKSVKLQWAPTKSADSTPLSNCPSNSAASYKQLPPATGPGSWNCDFGVVRVDLVPINGSTTTRGGLLANTFTAFFVPTTLNSKTQNVNFNGRNVYGGSVNQGILSAAGCTPNAENGLCYMTIKINSTNSSNYYMRVSIIYKDTTALDIFAYSTPGASAGQLPLKNAQALVDSTGQAQDVLRRIQVRIPMSNNGALRSDYALETTNSICKEFTTYPGFAADASGVSGCALP